MVTTNIYHVEENTVTEPNFIEYADNIQDQHALLNLLNKVSDEDLINRDNKQISTNTQMDRSGYLDFHENFCNEMRSITIKKNQDYTGNTTDPFANFKIVEHIGITSTEIGFLTRMSDKLARISSIVQTGQVVVLDESVQDTLLDLANYAALFAGYLKSKGNSDV